MSRPSLCTPRVEDATSISSIREVRLVAKGLVIGEDPSWGPRPVHPSRGEGNGSSRLGGVSRPSAVRYARPTL